MKVGNDFQVNADGKLKFNEGIVHPQADVRKLSDAKNVLYEKIPLTEEPIYFMYRNVHYAKDEEAIRNSGIRYDITVILPGTLGKEFIKTVGHFHPIKPGTTSTYPEYYEVLDGHALYILQKNDSNNDLEEFIAVDAQTGDKVYIPHNYGHITVNIGDRPLVMANLIEATFKSDYQPFVDKKGAAYYVVKGAKGPELVFNNNYKNQINPDKQLATNRDQATPLVKGKTLYEALVASPSGFEFLK